MATRFAVMILLGFATDLAGAAEVSLPEVLAFFSGEQLYVRLTDYRYAPKDNVNGASAAAFVLGVADGLDGVKHPALGFCFKRPPTTNAREIIAIVHAFMEKYPQVRRHSGASVVAAALDQAFPCPAT